MAVLDRNMQQQSHRLDNADRYLVDYASAALVDPNLHTDTRMRLHATLCELVHDVMREAHEESVTPDELREAHEQTVTLEDGDIAKLLEAVLVDPNLHTDARMRLHEQIPDLVSAAHQRAAT